MAEEKTTEQEQDLDPVSTQESGYVDLHCHSEFSSLDGGAKVIDMAEKLRSLGRKSMALTDHGVMQGLPPFYDELRKAGMKPILGMEAYLTEDRFDKSKGTPTWHLTLVAETTEGYHNLCKISSHAFIDGVIMTFGRPRARADWDLLNENSAGIIAFTGCMASPVMGAIFAGDLTRAKANTQRLIDIFGKNNVFGEVQNVGITVGIPADSEIAKLLGKTALTEAQAAKYEEVEAGEVPLSQTEANHVLADHICKPLGLELVATGDTHYLNEDDADPHDTMICIGTGQLKKGVRRFSLLPKKYHMRSDSELEEALGDFPQAIANTKIIAERCHAEIEYGKELLPVYPFPEGFANSGTYLRSLCEEGLKERYEGTDRWEEAVERLEMELGVIASMGFNDYFLITWDLYNEANRRGIPSGPGRGSAAGSIVAYCLDITKLCPLEYDLLFERFLNPGRRSMPDIDMDFSDSRRKELMEYARDKYNTLAGCETAVAQIVTFQRYKAKNAIKDSARVLATADEDGRKDALRHGDRIAALVPNDPKVTMRSLWDGKHKQEGESLRKAYKQGGFAEEVIKQASWMEGMVKTYGLHAAAVIITGHDMTDNLPLQKFGPDKPLHTQYDMSYSERIGLLKMDFLGLSNLDIIWDACNLIEEVRGVKLSPYKDIPLDDEKTYELFARGETVGTFQFESSGMRASLQEVRPTEFRDLIALVALYRPGAMAHIPSYAARKNGRQEVSYLDPRLDSKSLQGETYGITIYQEQSMLIARELAGFTQAEADDLRKAIGKKLHDKMAEIKPKYFKGCQENNTSKEVADALWKDNEAAADYSFNKSHAACYAYVAYLTGWLKTNYPHEYMAALLTAAMGDKDKPRLFLTEAKRMGLQVLPPDINRSLNDFAVVEREEEPGEHDILFGLNAIRGVGEGVVTDLRAERERNGPFISVFDVIRRMPGLNKSVLQNLVKAGALDGTGATRQGMHDVIEEAQKRIKKERAAEERAFVNAVKARLESVPLQVEGVGEQASLMDAGGSAEDAFAAAVGKGRGPKSNGQKLTAAEKRGVEGGCKQVWAVSLEVDPEAIHEATLAALTKEALRLARKEAKEQHQAKVETIAGIADEEGSQSSAKEEIEQAAQLTLAAQNKALADEGTRLSALLLPHLTDEVTEREEKAQFESAFAAETDEPLSPVEWDNIERLNLERHMLGIYVTGHPLDASSEQWRAYVNEGTERGRELGQVSDADIGKTVIVVGAVVGKEAIKMRSGEFMYRLTLEDLSGAREMTIFPRTLEGGLDSLLETGSIICMEAGVQEDTFQSQRDAADAEDAGTDVEEGGSTPIKMTVSRIYKWDPARITDEFLEKARQRRAEQEAAAEKARLNPETPPQAVVSETHPQPQTPTTVRISIKKEQFNPEWVAQLEAICTEHPGEHPVKLILDGKSYRTKFAVAPSPQLTQAVKTLLHKEEAPAPTPV